MKKSIYIGWDPREHSAYRVTEHSLTRHLTGSYLVSMLHLPTLCVDGIYRRPKIRNNGKLIDTLSVRDDYDGSLSTEHACARFLVPHLAKTGWAAFMDGDMLVRADVDEVFQNLDPQHAVYCVKHNHDTKDKLKMDGRVQTNYYRKNWSSFMIFNCDHEANKKLTLEMFNSIPGRDLHRFCWINNDALIGELDPAWNFLVGHSNFRIEPKIVHFTTGTPDMPGYESCAFADEWRQELALVDSIGPR